jgi:hypothetical protein
VRLPLILATLLAIAALAACDDASDGADHDGADGGNGAATGGVGGGSSGAGAGGASGTDAGGAAGEAGCDPSGTWRIEYGPGCEAAGADLVFVERQSESTFAAAFANRRPGPSTCGAGEVPKYSAKSTFSVALCDLRLELETSWCFSGEQQCDDRVITLRLTPQGGDGTLEWTRCWNPVAGGDPVSCTATATRLAGAADCESVSGHDVCTKDAVTCSSGCGTPCVCEAGYWSCTYPKLGSTCVAGESCTYKQSDLGGFDSLGCVEPQGDPYFDGSLAQGGTECPAASPQGGTSCATFPADLVCAYPTGSVECTRGDAAAKTWNVQ